MRAKQMRTALVLISLALTAAALAGCGNSAPTQTTLAQVKPDVSNADPRLQQIVAQSGQILPGGKPAFEARLKSLHGLPVVVNKWASWCAPCAAEAPVLQQVAKKYGNRVAFLGVDSYDTAAGPKQFERKYPLPYPSYSDPDLKISELFPPAKSPPVTNIYDSTGRLVHTQVAQLPSAAFLEDLIERYAGPIPTAATS